MTPVPATIDSFINDLDTYIDFKDIRYEQQNVSSTMDANFVGIVFCSVHYLKIDGGNIKELLKKYGFDAIITDESHVGSLQWSRPIGVEV